MSQIFFTTLTAIGEAKHANAAVTGTKVNYQQLAVGDGNGVVPMPSRLQTALVNQVRRENINQVSIDPANTSQIIVEQVIPENVGGWWIREAGIYDDQGDLIAVASVPPTYKPQLLEGSGRTQIVRIVLLLSSTADVTLKIDPAIVMATRKYVDDIVATPSGVAAGTYGNKNHYPIVTVDARGRVTAADQIEVASVWDQIPTEYIGDIIFVKGLGEMWWVENAFLTGYRTKECGFPLQNIDRVNRSFTIALDGGFFDKTLPQFKGLYSFIQEHTLIVPEANYVDGEFFFCEAGANMVKLPNQDNMFWRNKGIDVDTANARAIGRRYPDTIRAHAHAIPATQSSTGANHAFRLNASDGSPVGATTTFGTGETRPISSTVAGWIAL